MFSQTIFKLGFLILLASFLFSCSVSNINSKNIVNSNLRLGLAYLNQGNLPIAKEKLLKAKVHDSKSILVNEALAYYYDKTGEIKEAEQCYLENLKRFPFLGMTLNNYGVFLCRHGKYLESEQYFLRAFKDKQYYQVADAYENAGICMNLMKEYNKATVYFLKALKHDPSKSQALEALLTLYLNLGRYEDALHAIESFPELAANQKKIHIFQSKIKKFVKNKEA